MWRIGDASTPSGCRVFVVKRSGAQYGSATVSMTRRFRSHRTRLKFARGRGAAEPLPIRLALAGRAIRHRCIAGRVNRPLCRRNRHWRIAHKPVGADQGSVEKSAVSYDFIDQSDIFRFRGIHDPTRADEIEHTRGANQPRQPLSASSTAQSPMINLRKTKDGRIGRDCSGRFICSEISACKHRLIQEMEGNSIERHSVQPQERDLPSGRHFDQIIHGRFLPANAKSRVSRRQVALLASPGPVRCNGSVGR